MCCYGKHPHHMHGAKIHNTYTQESTFFMIHTEYALEPHDYSALKIH